MVLVRGSMRFLWTFSGIICFFFYKVSVYGIYQGVCEG